MQARRPGKTQRAQPMSGCGMKIAGHSIPETTEGEPVGRVLVVTIVEGSALFNESCMRKDSICEDAAE